ncbi:hypothetical protein N7495_000065 [Penicillium taxi]|uniref:uncharacterized protein n=1 Tax=Penicillium taxi TaxID=168475 RepID=UPI002544F228|nr:uncharacterized protein N7495_000065 [Penicillium taxi]KAJ5907383.1 hypothetical protein N7495_000065 [Penicillium taxi]
MSVSYNSDATLQDATWVAMLLSERDVAGQIPINFVTNPGVSLSSACFADGLYARIPGADCISNLLSIGYRRLVLDIYWSVERRTWSFCPVEVPKKADVTVSAYTSTFTSTSTTSTMTLMETASTTTGAASPTITAYTDSHGDAVYELGPYRCTNDLDLYTLTEVLTGYFKATSTELTGYIIYLALNLHVAGSDAEPTKPASAVTGNDLPKIDIERAGAFFKTVLSNYIYTPVTLASDRSNLNASWYEVEEDYKPITEYFTIHRDETGQQSTPDGWPSSKFILLANTNRILIEYGSIDPQLADYDWSQDGEVIFPPSYLTSATSTSTTNDTFSSSCIYNPEATDVSQANSSWAISNGLTVADGLSPESTMSSINNVIAGLTACGISPFLNSTLFGQSADVSISNYRNLSLSTGWAWAPGEPQGAGTGGGTEGQPSFDRCAIIDPSLQGRWRATNCSDTRRGTCRVGNSPFEWTLSHSTGDFSSVSNLCPSGSEFAVPRNGIENTYLYKYLLTQSDELSTTADSGPGVFLDFNSISVTSCWVSGGPKTACPYISNPQQLERRTVLVAAIAGIVICIIAALTGFVKCNANRRNSRRRKRVIAGWEYEGVPS